MEKQKVGLTAVDFNCALSLGADKDIHQSEGDDALERVVQRRFFSFLDV